MNPAIIRIGAIALLAAGLIAIPACQSLPQPLSRNDSQRCISATIEELASDPRRFEDRRICTTGFLGRMVPYGEDSAKLYATRAQAEATFADAYILIALPLDLLAQERLSRYSTQRAEVEGIFTYDHECWPRSGEAVPDYNCSPRYPMRLRQPTLRFADGALFPLPLGQTNEHRRALGGPTEALPATPTATAHGGSGGAASTHVSPDQIRIANPPSTRSRNAVFVNPSDYLARPVQVCGYMIDGSNIVESRARQDWVRTSGLSIRENGPLDLRFRGRVCVEGTVSHLGCESSMSCTGAAFDYAISVRRVLSLAPGPGHGDR